MNQYNPTIIIRIGQNALSFAVADPSKEGGIAFEPYVLRSNMSLSARMKGVSMCCNSHSTDMECFTLPKMLLPQQVLSEVSRAG